MNKYFVLCVSLFVTVAYAAETTVDQASVAATKEAAYLLGTKGSPNDYSLLDVTAEVLKNPYLSWQRFITLSSADRAKVLTELSQKIEYYEIALDTVVETLITVKGWPREQAYGLKKQIQSYTAKAFNNYLQPFLDWLIVGKEYENDPRGMYDLSDPADVARMEADKKRPLADLKKREVPEYSVVDKGLLSLVGAGKWLYDRGADGLRAADGAVRSRGSALSRWWRRNTTEKSE